MEKDSDVALEKGNSSIDWYLAFHKVSYHISAARGINGWYVDCIVSDLYNFEYWMWPSIDEVPSVMKTAINNYGAFAQEVGVLNTYKIMIGFNDPNNPSYS